LQSAGKRPLGRPRHRQEDNIKLILMKQYGRAWTEFIWLRTAISSCSCEHDNESSGYIKCRKFLY